jgi:hypothetical protein
VLSDTKLIAKTSDLSIGGCFLYALSPFPEGTNVRIRINAKSNTFTTLGKVVCVLRNMGMGVAFSSVADDQATILQEWISKLSRGELRTGSRLVHFPGGFSQLLTIFPSASCIFRRMDGPRQQAESAPLFSGRIACNAMPARPGRRASLNSPATSEDPSTGGRNTECADLLGAHHITPGSSHRAGHRSRAFPHSGGIVHSGVGESGNGAKLFRPRFRELLHFGFRSKMQAARGARFDAGWFGIRGTISASLTPLTRPSSNRQPSRLRRRPSAP